jgi:hypothetical protein
LTLHGSGRIAFASGSLRPIFLPAVAEVKPVILAFPLVRRGRCHRVIRADGTLCGYGGGLWRKKWLLDHERRWRSGD